MITERKTTRLRRHLVSMLLSILLGLLSVPPLLPVMRSDASLWQVEGTLALILIGLFLCWQAQMALHEAGHLVFGLATGYHFVSYRFRSLVVTRHEGRLRLSRQKVAGTGGQCILRPMPWQEGGVPYRLYHLGGVLVNLISALICGLLAWAAQPVSQVLFAICYLLCVTGLISAVMNGIPMKTTLVANDGYNLRHMRGNLAVQHACWQELITAAALTEGKRLAEMPAAWFEAPETEHDVFASHMRLCRAEYLMDQERWPEALPLIRATLTGELLGYDEMLLKCNEMSLSLLAGEASTVEEIWDTPEAQKQRASMRFSPTVLRSEVIRAWVKEGDPAAAQKKQEAFDRVAARYVYPQTLEVDRTLMRMAEAMAKGAADPCA